MMTLLTGLPAELPVWGAATVVGVGTVFEAAGADAAMADAAVVEALSASDPGALSDEERARALQLAGRGKTGPTGWMSDRDMRQLFGDFPAVVVPAVLAKLRQGNPSQTSASTGLALATARGSLHAAGAAKAGGSTPAISTDTLNRQAALFLKAGEVKKFNGLRTGNPDWKPDLRGAILRGAILIGANLREADLIGADLFRADLRGAILIGANLRGAILIGADLSEADLRGVDLRGVDLRGAKGLDEERLGQALSLVEVRITEDQKAMVEAAMAIIAKRARDSMIVEG